MGKFYELFEMDAHIGAKELDLQYMKVFIWLGAFDTDILFLCNSPPIHKKKKNQLLFTLEGIASSK